MSKKKKPISINIRCQCEDSAVKRPESLLVTVYCKGCGKVFRTNTKKDLCFDWERKR
jgi:hypothetical protein